jgi:hypothetical protein
VQASFTIVTYDRQNIFIIRATGLLVITRENIHKNLLKFWLMLFEEGPGMNEKQPRENLTKHFFAVIYTSER